MKIDTLEKINQLERRYCRDCLVKKHNRDKGNRSSAHKFCITECSIGLEIKSHGNQLQ